MTPGNASALANALQTLARNPRQLAGWAEKTEWVRRFAPEEILPQFERMLSTVAQLN